MDSRSRRAGRRDGGTGADRPATHRSIALRLRHPRVCPIPTYGISGHPIASNRRRRLSDNASPPKTYAPAAEADRNRPASRNWSLTFAASAPSKSRSAASRSFDVVVTNRGDAPARKIKLLARFDAGLSHVRAVDNELAVKYEGMRDLVAGRIGHGAADVRRAGGRAAMPPRDRHAPTAPPT